MVAWHVPAAGEFPVTVWLELGIAGWYSDASSLGVYVRSRSITFQSVSVLLADPEGATRTEAKGRRFFTFLSKGSSAILPAPCRCSEGRDLLLEGSPKSVCARFLNRSDRHSLFASEGQTTPFLMGAGFCETAGEINFLLVSATDSGNLVWTLIIDSAALNLWDAFCCSLQVSFAGDILEISGFFVPIPGGVLA